MRFGQFIATSPDLTLNGVFLELYQNCLKSGIEIILGLLCWASSSGFIAWGLVSWVRFHGSRFGSQAAQKRSRVAKVCRSCVK